MDTAERIDALETRLDALEDSVSLLAELWRSGRGTGMLSMHPSTRDRAEELAPLFRRAERESAALEGGPVPRHLLAAIAWTESAFHTAGPKAIGPEVPGTDHRAYGLMQIWSGHFGNDLGTWPGDGTVRIGRRTWTDAWTNLKAGTLILLDAGWGQGVPAREVLRRYSGAREGNLDAINDYTEKVTNRYTVLRFGGPLGLSVEGL